MLRFGLRKDVLCQEGIILLWHGHGPFCYLLVFKKFLSLPNHSIRACVKGKRISCGVGYGLQIFAEYISYEQRKH